ncbi:hypothetical protein Taro_005498 [Colocasia esculenta]|uniref:Uncharacterized protein n=1 Tax=Colocasia esculenta TaxID=4460 RepID=A0A843TUS3_COLES|nr:hypothetical protein [Colocasia esculenta]
MAAAGDSGGAPGQRQRLTRVAPAARRATAAAAGAGSSGARASREWRRAGRDWRWWGEGLATATGASSGGIPSTSSSPSRRRGASHRGKEITAKDSVLILGMIVKKLQSGHLEGDARSEADTKCSSGARTKREGHAAVEQVLQEDWQCIYLQLVDISIVEVQELLELPLFFQILPRRPEELPDKEVEQARDKEDETSITMSRMARLILLSRP